MAESGPDGFSLDTLLAAAAEDAGGAVVPPIVQTSLFTFDSYQAFEDRMAGRSNDPLYTRVQNPTVAAFEDLVAAAEQGEAAVGFASGMAAISSTVFAFVRPGDRIACVEHVYPDAYRLFERLMRPFGVEVSYHPVEAFEKDPDLPGGREARLSGKPGFGGLPGHGSRRRGRPCKETRDPDGCRQFLGDAAVSAAADARY
ncbi:PLP-dependent transferase [Novosphingobium sp. MW5]|nr:PLP-dependent transferase [Novosphingobium sp. MW5]